MHEKKQFDIKVPTMLTVKETAALFKGSGITESFLRRGIRDGTITHVTVGRKILINVDRLIDYLNGTPRG